MTSLTAHKIKGKIIKFLRWSEKYTKTDMVYLIGGGSWLFGAQAVGAVSAFVVTVLLTSLLPKETFGQYRFVLAVIPMLAIAALPGINTATTRFVAQGAHIDLLAITKVKIKWGLIGSLASLFVALYYFSQGNNLLAYIFGISALFIPFFETFFIYSDYYKGKQNFKTPAIYEAISRVIQAFLMVIVALITKNILVLVSVFFIGQITTRLFFFIRTLKSQTIKQDLISKDELNSQSEIIKYGKHLTLIGVLGVLYGSIDKLLIWHFLGSEALAIYIVAFTIPTSLALLFGFLPQVLLPKFTQKNYSEKSEQKKLFKKLSMFTGIMFIIPIIYIPLAPIIMSTIFPAYSTSIFISQLLSLIIPLFVLVGIIWQLLIARKRNSVMLFIIIASLITSITAFIILKDSLGITAMFVSLGLSNLLIILLSVFALRSTKCLVKLLNQRNKL